LPLYAKSIAIIDDEQDILNLFLEVLEDEGYQTTGFTNPVSFLEYIKQCKDEFDFIILDYRISPKESDELANQVYEINPKVKIVLLTANSDIVTHTSNLEVIKKPINLHHLLDIVKRYMNGSVVN
jgi:DNA-binding NtrC family response regulator